MGTWNVERGNVERATWNVGTWERGNVGTWNVERGNVGTWNVERGTWNVSARQIQPAIERGAAVQRPHSFIRYPFVDSGDDDGTLAGTARCAPTVGGAAHRRRTRYAGGRGLPCPCTLHAKSNPQSNAVRRCSVRIRLFVIHSLTAAMMTARWRAQHAVPPRWGAVRCVPTFHARQSTI